MNLSTITTIIFFYLVYLISLFLEIPVPTHSTPVTFICHYLETPLDVLRISLVYFDVHGLFDFSLDQFEGEVFDMRAQL